MNEGSPLSGVNVVLVMAYGSLVFVLLFIFVKRQIMRFAVKSRRGPHVPVGHNAPKDLKEEIESRLFKVNNIRYEPKLLSHDDDRLKQNGCYNYLYRMQALDAIRDADIVSPDLARSPSALTGPCYRKWLLDLRNFHTLIKTSHRSLIDRLLDGYDNARHGTAVFGEAEFLKYKEDLAELAAIVKVHSSTSSLNHQHQSAAKDLTSSPGPSSASTIQVTYLPSSGQRSKRPKHFLELKNFKDNYNTLESTL
ncbi:protein C1orf43 homolog isoform X1 [Tachysurus fulvidraco]|uniref:protein C1orf43 homolog isoform X1 n=2 Tax=Tachysurus fulvidraco TaxID=1234273 RepID=UPI001FEDE25F|nr:protein C1orf43 homolog isoform X1 [Tachysurus fulvidraco]